MPIVDIIERPNAPPPLTDKEWAWIKDHPGKPLIRYIDNESTRRAGRAILAAEMSARAGGVLPEAKAYPLPAILYGQDMVEMGSTKYAELIAAANWMSSTNLDAVINLDHPDVKAAL